MKTAINHDTKLTVIPLLDRGIQNKQPMATEPTEKHGLNTSSQATIITTKSTKDYKWCITARMWDVDTGFQVDKFSGWQPQPRHYDTKLTTLATLAGLRNRAIL
jgi:hypothetical protein